MVSHLTFKGCGVIAGSLYVAMVGPTMLVLVNTYLLLKLATAFLL